MKLERILTIGTSGDDVKWMQQRLSELGFHKGRCEGHYGQNTLVSVTSFQRKMGLKTNGIVSLQTWSKLNANNSSEKDIKVKSKLAFVDETGLKIFNSNLSEDYYYDEETTKDIIYIKNSLTSYYPNIDNWDKAFRRDRQGVLKYDENNKLIPLKSSTTFTIGGYSYNDTKYDGKVFNNYDDKFWSFHSPFLNTDKKINPRCISIEICNYGPLIEKDKMFYTKNGVIIPSEEVIKINFRGYKYWHRYTKPQIDSLRKLLLHLAKKWNIKLGDESYNLEWFNYNKKYDGYLRTDSQISFDAVGLSPQPELIQMLNNL